MINESNTIQIQVYSARCIKEGNIKLITRFSSHMHPFWVSGGGGGGGEIISLV